VRLNRQINTFGKSILLIETRLEIDGTRNRYPNTVFHAQIDYIIRYLVAQGIIIEYVKHTIYSLFLSIYLSFS